MKRFNLEGKGIEIVTAAILCLGLGLGIGMNIRYANQMADSNVQVIADGSSVEAEVPTWAASSGLVPTNVFFNSNGIGYILSK